MLFQTVDLGVRLAPYEPTWALQRQIHSELVAGEREDTILLVEHEPVYTAGRRTHTWDRPPAGGVAVVDIDRGGKVTWHGPGQLVAYPIIRLREPLDVIEYVRTLEQAVMDVCEHFGLTTTRVEDRTGVWLKGDEERRDRKICAIGVKVAQRVTMHGIALNCDPDLHQFDFITPCGISDADVTSLSAELGRDVSIAEALPVLEQVLATRLAPITQAGQTGQTEQAGQSSATEVRHGPNLSPIMEAAS